MSNTSKSRLLFRNRLLAALPDSEIKLLRPHLEPVAFEPGSIVYQAGDTISHAYFPNDGMVSLLSVTEQGQTVEVGFTGFEGMVGLPAILGQTEMPYQAMVQVKAECWRVETKHILELFSRCGAFHDIVLRYFYVVVKQISQTCVCNHFHTIEARLCRWLTVMRERSGDKHLTLTQEFLSHMLGVQRTSIGMIAQSMQNDGIIRYRRGKIEIVDDERLKSAACECFHIVREEQEKFINDKNFPVMSDN
ncbi:MAG TPA: Crp/Fnr family transcriptional regulator [Pyrinomonadaceae bacterium]|jgi:CRP-like cAMP-binding protein